MKKQILLVLSAMLVLACMLTFSVGAECAHDCETKVVEPTCSAIGYTEISCKNCDYKYITDKTAPVSCSFVEGEKFIDSKIGALVTPTSCEWCERVAKIRK